jgi:hypothetical protein
MKIKTMHDGGRAASYASSFIHLKIWPYENTEITIDLTEDDSSVRPELIAAFREIADELELQNKRLLVESKK